MKSPRQTKPQQEGSPSSPRGTFRFPHCLEARAEEWRRQYELGGDEEILKFARKDRELAKRQDWVQQRMKELARSPHEHERRKARAFARICGERFEIDRA